VPQKKKFINYELLSSKDVSGRALSCYNVLFWCDMWTVGVKEMLSFQILLYTQNYSKKIFLKRGAGQVLRGK
jgi:3-deoxy-D-arabino-heptulosonate 7-phosphate (DAHP) synthase